MPKIKTNKLASKKFRKLGGSKKIKHARASTSHMTGKRSNKRNRHLKGTKIMDATSTRHFKVLLPY